MLTKGEGEEGGAKNDQKEGRTKKKEGNLGLLQKVLELGLLAAHLAQSEKDLVHPLGGGLGSAESSLAEGVSELDSGSSKHGGVSVFDAGKKGKRRVKSTRRQQGTTQKHARSTRLLLARSKGVYEWGISGPRGCPKKEKKSRNLERRCFLAFFHFPLIRFFSCFSRLNRTLFVLTFL